MSIPIQQSSRSLSHVFNSSRRTCCCSRSKRSLNLQYIQKRAVSSTQFQPQQPERETTSESTSQTSPSSSEPSPRWARTPPGMAAPFRAKPYPANYKPFPVNKDPKKLDEMYTKLLGKNGPNMLSDETKWLAVTHKSFDHGRRGFNDRLAYLGKRILELQCSIGLVTNTAAVHTPIVPRLPKRVPFSHPATEGIEQLTLHNKEMLLDPKQISRVAGIYGIPGVVRWQPRDVDNLGASGEHVVYAQAILAIIGALSLEQGGAVANRVAKERILQPSGVRDQILAKPTHDAAIESE